MLVKGDAGRERKENLGKNEKRRYKALTFQEKKTCNLSLHASFYQSKRTGKLQ